MKKPSKDKVMQQLSVVAPAELLNYLVEKQVRGSRSAIKSLLKHKQILVNDKIVTQFDYNLKINDRIAVMYSDQSKKEKKLQGLKIVFEDDYIIVVDKDSSFLSVATPKEPIKTVYNVLTTHIRKSKIDSKMYVLHRMDRECSGLMIWSKSEDVQMLFRKNWKLLVHEYVYSGVIEGQLTPEEGTIESWLTENKNFQVFSASFDNGGHNAITHYSTVRGNGKCSLVRFRQETSGKNQLRAQMQQKGTPIVGDKKYGSTINPIKRIALHADSIRFKHPISGRMIELKSALPRSISQLVNPNNTITDEQQ